MKKISNCEINVRFIETWYGKSTRNIARDIWYLSLCVLHEYPNDIQYTVVSMSGYTNEKEMTVHTKINRKRGLQLLFVCFYFSFFFCTETCVFENIDFTDWNVINAFEFRSVWMIYNDPSVSPLFPLFPLPSPPRQLCRGKSNGRNSVNIVNRN